MAVYRRHKCLLHPVMDGVMLAPPQDCAAPFDCAQGRLYGALFLFDPFPEIGFEKHCAKEAVSNLEEAVTVFGRIKKVRVFCACLLFRERFKFLEVLLVRAARLLYVFWDDLRIQLDENTSDPKQRPAESLNQLFGVQPPKWLSIPSPSSKYSPIPDNGQTDRFHRLPSA